MRSFPDPHPLSFGRLRRVAFVAFLLAIPAATGLSAAGLEVVPPPASGRFELVRGVPETVTLSLRNGGDAPLEIGSVFFRPAEGVDPAAFPELPRLVGLDGRVLAPGETATAALVLPAFPQAEELGGGFYLEPKEGPPATAPFYPITLAVSEPPVGVLGSKAAGWAASLFALLVLVLTLYLRVTDKSGSKRNFFQSPDGTYSVSRFQVWLWTLIIVFSYAYLFFSQGLAPAFPTSIWALLGISMTSIATATTIAVRNGAAAPATPPAAPAASPAVSQNPIANMLSEKGNPSVMRLQMFAWTVAAAVFFVVHVYHAGELWDVPENLLILMGISHGGYLADKAAKKK